jgi:multicomponent Na+:H+ antiporter subunit B
MIVNLSLLTLLALTAIAIVRLRGLLAVVMLAGIYSFISAGLLTWLDAVDVAMTEAAVGAGISTVLFLLAMKLTGSKEAASSKPQVLPLAVVLVTGGCLVYGTFDMPSFGEPTTPAQEHVAPRYLEDSYHEIGIPNVVTSVLASYRGYDTLGEVAVVFTAAIGVLLLLGLVRQRRPRVDDGPDPEVRGAAGSANAADAGVASDREGQS